MRNYVKPNKRGEHKASDSVIKMFKTEKGSILADHIVCSYELQTFFNNKDKSCTSCSRSTGPLRVWSARSRKNNGKLSRIR